MNVALRQRLASAAQDVRLREILTFLYRDHPQGASFEGLKEMLFLHEDFHDDRFQQLARDPLILMDEFLR